MKETIKSIIEWHETTFPDATLEGQVEKFKKERQEWLDSNEKDISELADMFIVACGIMRFGRTESAICFGCVGSFLRYSDFTDSDFRKAVDKKMEINRQRKWNFENGQYQHKEE